MYRRSFTVWLFRYLVPPKKEAKFLISEEMFYLIDHIIIIIVVIVNNQIILYTQETHVHNILKSLFRSDLKLNCSYERLSWTKNWQP